MNFEKDSQRLVQNIDTMSVQEIVDVLNQYRVLPEQKFKMTVPIFSPNAFYYRGRKFDESKKFSKKHPIKISDLSYPSSDIPQGRANRDGQSMFYCSNTKETVFLELGLEPGQEFILSNWQCSAPVVAPHIGYTKHIFEQMGAKRDLPMWADAQASISSFPVNPEEEVAKQKMLLDLSKEDPFFFLKKFFNDEFVRKDRKFYKLTTAIAEMHQGNVLGVDYQICGIAYPSVAMSANGDNFAINPSFVDKNFAWKRAAHLRLKEITPEMVFYEEIDYSTELDGEGNLIWKGHGKPQWTLPAGQHDLVTMPGPDEFGHYEIWKDGQPCHKRVYDLEENLILPN